LAQSKKSVPECKNGQLAFNGRCAGLDGCADRQYCHALW